MVVGLIGYTIFLSANHQRDRCRRARGPCVTWGREATFATYSTADGVVHETRLLTSGWWGVARHANYVGDLLMAVAFSLTCGFTHLLPYGYAIFLAILLVHRTYRDDRRCRVKYGPAWGMPTAPACRIGWCRGCGERVMGGAHPSTNRGEIFLSRAGSIRPLRWM